jgi:hypothetical protein
MEMPENEKNYLSKMVSIKHLVTLSKLNMRVNSLSVLESSGSRLM